MEWKYDWGERLRLEAETAGICKSGANIWKARLSAFFWRSSATTITSPGKSTPTRVTSCVASTHGQLRSPTKPSEWVELIRVKQVLRISELIWFTGVIGLKRVLRYIRNFRIIRAGLREAARVLAQVLWTSWLQREFACFRTILQSKRPAYNPTSRNNAKITLISLET